MSNIYSRIRFRHNRLTIIALALMTITAVPRVIAQTQLQTVSIPFITTFAGLAAGASPANAICSASLPVYAVSGTGAKYGDGCPATQASLSVPLAVAADKSGNIFISDQTHQIIRVVYNGSGSDALAAAIIAANVQNPGLVPVKGDIYTIAGGTTIAPATHYCNGLGTGPQGSDLELDGCPGAQTYEALNRGVAVDADGNVFLSNGAVYPTIRVFYVGGAKAAALIQLVDPTITPQPGYVYKVAGYGGTTFRTTGNTCPGSATLTYTDILGDGCPAAQAYMNSPRGLIVDASENIYFADQSDNVVRRIDGVTSIITNVAGTCVLANSTSTSCTATATSGDGNSATSTAVNIYAPYGVALDQYGNLFIAEGGSSSLAGRIRVVYSAGTLPGITNPTQGYIYTYAGGSASSGTPAQMATFQLTYGVSLDPSGYLYIDDYRSGISGSNHIWRVDPVSGNILILAGTGNSALAAGQHCDRIKQLGIVTPNSLGDGCPATQSYLNVPQGPIAFDSNGNAYFADRGNNVVRKLYYNNVFPPTAVGSTSASLPQAFYFPSSTILLSKSATLQGSPTTEFASTTTTNDNCPLAAALPATPDTCVSYVTFTPAAAGYRNAVYNLIDATGTVATGAVTGTGIAPVLAIHLGAGVTIGSSITPAAVSSDLHGNVYVSDIKNNQVLRSTITGGTGTAILSGLGLPRQSSVDNFGNLYVADAGRNSIVKLPYGSTAGITFVAGLNAPQGVVADSLGGVYIADTGNNRLLYYSGQNGTTSPVSTYPVTLSAPTSLSLDGTGNLYIIDTNHTRVVELPIGQPATTMSLPIGATPAAIAFDSANEVYLADTASASILLVTAGSTNVTPLITGLVTPASIALTSSGNIFVADSSATAATGYNVAVNNSTFTTTNIPNSSLPITLTLSDVGNLAATLATPPYIETGGVAAFPGSGTATCNAAVVLAPGGTCTQAFTFSPTVAGQQTAKVIFNTTTAQSVTANFTAIATNLINTTLNLSLLNATASYGQTVTYTVTLTPNTLTTPLSGTINFMVDGLAQPAKSVVGSPYTYTFTVSTTVGVHSISVAYSGDSVYGGSNAFTFLTIAKATTAIVSSYTETSAGTVLTAVVTPASIGAFAFTGKVFFYVDNVLQGTVSINGAGSNGSASTTVVLADGSHSYYVNYSGDPNYAGSTSTPVQTLIVGRAISSTALAVNTTTNASGAAGWIFTIKVTSATTGAPTGTVTLTNGATLLATLTLTPASNGVATYFTTTTTYTAFSFVATYSGDGLYEPSASVASDFFVIAPLSIRIPQGSQINSSITVAPVSGYTGTLTANCAGLPANALCRYYNTPVVVSGTTAVTFSLQMYSGVNPNVASLSRPRLMPGPRGMDTGGTFAFLLLAPAAFAVRRRHSRKLLLLMGLALLPLITLGITGCGIKTPANTNTTYTTPTGTYLVTLTLTDANGISHSNSISVFFAP